MNTGAFGVKYVIRMYTIALYLHNGAVVSTVNSWLGGYGFENDIAQFPSVTQRQITADYCTVCQLIT